ncbi:MAG: sulfite oxidase-like oxidoreductase [Alphaproteobacteria bacterium]|nr:sulfite oxidase-like oxidoreductase [Alphaproteobacteria bacterium]
MVSDADDDAPAPDPRRVAARLRAVREGRHLTGRGGAADRDRLPPGQRVVEKWPVLDLGVHPNIPRDKWRLQIGGLVERPLTLDWAAFAALPESDIVSDVHCVTSWSVYENRWTGVAAADLLAHVGPKAEARFVLLHGSDGYTTNLPLSRFAAPDSVIAHAWNGAPLAKEHGGPVRAVIPALYFWKSAKWLRRITLVAEDAPGYWEVRGYHNDADPWREERYG